jgi:hypothetical protein
MSPVPQGTAEFIAHISQPSLRGLGVFLKHPQHFVLGYFQSSRQCRDSLALRSEIQIVSGGALATNRLASSLLVYAQPSDWTKLELS